MKNIHITKFGAMMAIVCFLFLPIAGCGSMTFTGVDFFKMGEIDTSVKLFAALAMIFAVVIIFLKDKFQIFSSAIAGLALLVIAYMVAKGKMHSGDSFGMSNGIELKSGSYLSMIGFIISAVVSKTKNEILGDQRSSHSSSTPNKNKQSKFCSSCGMQIDDNEMQFCKKCGTKL
jgi:hypothetical protein